MEDVIISESGTQPVQELASGAVPDVPSGDRQRLADEIRHLWAAHVEAKAAAKRVKAELKEIRRRLAGPLAEMKGLLARPGRNGVWSSFLRSEGISRATAERLARKGGESDGTRAEVMPTACPSPGEPSGDSVSLSFVTGDGAAEVAGPAPQAPEGGGANPADAPAVDLDPQPPDAVSAAATQEAQVEIAATPAEAGQAAKAADGVSGGDVAPVESEPGAAVADAGNLVVA